MNVDSRVAATLKQIIDLVNGEQAAETLPWPRFHCWDRWLGSLDGGTESGHWVVSSAELLRVDTKSVRI